MFVWLCLEYLGQLSTLSLTVCLAGFLGHEDAVNELLAQNCDVNVCSACDRVTPLYLAIHYGHSQCAQILLAHGADPRLANKDGTTCLMQAELDGDDQLAQLLLQAGAVKY